jgi:hypothetical protein
MKAHQFYSKILSPSIGVSVIDVSQRYRPKLRNVINNPALCPVSPPTRTNPIQSVYFL